MGWAAIATALLIVQPPAMPEGAEIELMILSEVSAARARVGDLVRLQVHRPLVKDGRVLIAAGTPAFGEVTAVEKSGMAMKRGSLAIRLTRITLDGRDLPLAASLDTRGQGGKSDDMLKVVFAPIYAPFAMGNSAKFKAGDLVKARLAVPVPEPAVPPAP